MIKIKRLFFLYLRATARSRKRIDARGQTLVEYALILAFISVVAISVLISLGAKTQELYTTIDSQIARAPGGVNYVPSH